MRARLKKAARPPVGTSARGPRCENFLQNPDQLAGAERSALAGSGKNAMMAGAKNTGIAGTSMQISKDTLAGRTIVAIVYVAVVTLLAAGIFVGVWTAHEMNDVLTEQFNAQQMVLAQTTRARIEREIGEIKRELTSQAVALRRTTDPRESLPALQQSMERLQSVGVRRVEVVDLDANRVFTAGYHGSWSERNLGEGGVYRHGDIHTGRAAGGLGLAGCGEQRRGGHAVRCTADREGAAAGVSPERVRPAVLHRQAHPLRQQRLRLGDGSRGPFHLSPQSRLLRPQCLCGPR